MRNTLVCVTVGLLVGVVGTPVLAQVGAGQGKVAAVQSVSLPKAPSLIDYLLLAQQNDQAYQAARYQYESESKSANLAQWAFAPSLNFSASKEHNEYKIEDYNTPGVLQNKDYSPSSGSLTLSQRIFDKGRGAYQDENEIKAERARWVFDAARQDLALRVLQVYADYLLALDQVALAQAQFDALNAQVVQLQQLLVSKSATITELAEARARMELAKVQIKSTASALEISKRQFAKTVGKQPGKELTSFHSSPKLELPEPGDVSQWVQQALLDNPEVKAQALVVRLSDTAIAKAKAGYYPTVVVSATRMLGSHSSYILRRDVSSSVGISLNMNLFDGGTTSTVTQQAQLQALAQQATLEDVRAQVETNTVKAYWDVYNGVAQVQAMELAQESAALAVQGIRMGIKAGIRTYAEELNAVQQLFNVRRDLQRERYKYLVSRLTLASMTGKADEAAVRMIDALTASTR